MAFNDPLVRLGDYVEACLGKMLDAQKNRGAFQPYLGNSNVRWGAFDLQDLAVMRFEQQEEERYGLRDGDLVVCEGGEPGRCAIWQGEVPNMKIQKALHRIRVKDGLDNYFLYYWFLHAGKTGALEPYFTGTTIKHLTGKALAELKIPLPTIERQRGLAKVLRSLDDKIDINRSINQTLEAMAQAIFKSWFVDFDPVKAKIAAIEQGQDPLRAAMRAISGKTDAELDRMPREHHDQLAATAALFPDAMEESELGEIPKGWEVSTIGEMVEIAGGATPDTKNELYWSPPEHFWTSPKDLSGAQSPVLLATGRKISTAGLARISSGLLPKGTLLMSSRAPIGYLAITQISVAINQGYIAMLPGGKLPPLYLLMWCHQNMEEIKGQANGSTFMEISKKAFRPIPIIYPGLTLTNSFVDAMAPLFGRIVEGVRESSQLSELRDTLLPKLLSGELPLTPSDC